MTVAPDLSIVADAAPGTFGTERLRKLLELRAWITDEIATERRRLALCDELTILEAAADVYGVEVAAILAGRRETTVVRARHLTCWLMRQHGMSYPHIGRMLGQDHTTAMNAVRMVETKAPLRAIGRALLTQIGEAS